MLRDYTPPLSEVGIQVPRSILSSWYAFSERENFNWFVHT